MTNEVEEQKPAGPEQTGGSLPKSPGKKSWSVKMIVAWVVSLVVLFLAVMSVGIYRFQWQGEAVRKIEAVVPFPAAVINGQIVTIGGFTRRFEAYKKAITYNQAFDFNDPANVEVVKQQKDAVLTRMIDLKAEEALARKKNISVSADEVNAEVQAVIEQSGTPAEELDKILANVYGWDRNKFTEEVIMPGIRERKLENLLALDKQENSEAYSIANEVKTDINQGKDFVELAKKFSSDETTKDKGGDLGWTVPAAFVPEFSETLNKLKVGETSDVVASNYGLHIIQLLGKKQLKGEAEQVHARHILIKTKDYKVWLEEQKKDMGMWKFAFN